MTCQVEQEDQARIDEYLKSLKVDAPASPEEVRNMLRAAIGDRGLMVYLIWRLLDERYPETDATGLLREACRRFGEMKARKFGEVGTPAEWLMKLSSRAGVLAWAQEIVELNEDRAVKVFHHCPHVAAARAAGASDNELVHLCRDIMMAADYGTIEPFPHLKLSFPGKTCAEGGKCVMTVTRAQS